MFTFRNNHDNDYDVDTIVYQLLNYLRFDIKFKVTFCGANKKIQLFFQIVI